MSDLHLGRDCLEYSVSPDSSCDGLYSTGYGLDMRVDFVCQFIVLARPRLEASLLRYFCQYSCDSADISGGLQLIDTHIQLVSSDRLRTVGGCDG